MNVSFIAMNRIAEDEAAGNPAYRRELARTGKVLLSDARELPDSDLLEKLERTGIALDKESFRRLCREALSAQEINAMLLTPELRPGIEGKLGEDWVWLALTVLWERWFPEWPGFERFDDLMQEGYRCQADDPGAACDIWLDAWDAFLRLYDMGGFASLRQFDERFGGSQFVFNWVQDFGQGLHEASFSDSARNAQNIRICEEFLRRFPAEDALMLENARRDLAEAVFQSGDRAKGDALFDRWMADDLQWGWGWIGWSDNYFLFASDSNRNALRAESLLRQGLAVAGVRDRADILERFAGLCRELGRSEEAMQFERQCAAERTASEPPRHRIAPGRITLDFGEPGLPLSQLSSVRKAAHREHVDSPAGAGAHPAKPSRNDPCPCGSGRKFKKCCGP
jgi:hypothetical protein